MTRASVVVDQVTGEAFEFPTRQAAAAEADARNRGRQVLRPDWPRDRQGGPRFVVVQALDDAPTSWRDVVMAELAKAGGAVSLSDLYRAIARHPKAADAPNWRPKVRQTLQRAGARRVGPGQWEIAQ